ncbi:SAM domain-containing protein SAMSN-1 isoform X1 [Pleurodeles waltl]|uniref:SAM domain-containing protein SAMSN-1 isoform X1 n=1 Tax=Pleurodeles waltl TaxID=8319 RepID=UPI00370961F1
MDPVRKTSTLHSCCHHQDNLKQSLPPWLQEGSMDSLYERVQETQNPKESLCRDVRSQFNSVMKFIPPDRSLSFELSDFDHTDAKKRWKRSMIQKSMSENEAFERKTLNSTFVQNSKKSEKDTYNRRHCHLEELTEDEFPNGERTHLLSGKKSDETPGQMPSYEQWIPPRVQSPVEKDLVTESEDNKSESMGTLKRLKKLVQAKKANGISMDDAKNVLISSNYPNQAREEEDDEEETLTTCMKLTKPQEKRTLKDNTGRKTEPVRSVEYSSASLDRFHHSRWSSPADVSLHSDVRLWSDWKPFPDTDLFPFDVALPKMEAWGNCTFCSHHPWLPYSFTDIDLSCAWRASSFGSFDRFRHQSVSKPEDSDEICESENVCEDGDQAATKAQSSTGGIGKKMKAISLTMKKKMGRKYIKALSEDGKEDDGGDGDGETHSYRNSYPGGTLQAEKISLKGSDSSESLYSLNSGQSSSSGVTSYSDGTSNRDSFRLDEDVPYTGPFCGRAKVHTDFTPSPYDTDSLKIKKGDVIDIISKTPMGMWTGMLNNKVGNFKFIYVDIISEEETAPKKTLVRKRSRRPRPKTLQEFLERIHLQDWISTLLLNGYETLEDLKDMKESHLIELNITNPEDRARLLAAAENLHASEFEQEHEQESASHSSSLGVGLNKEELKDCPRDSGCYISSENSDNGRDDTETEHLCDAVQKITITESN